MLLILNQVVYPGAGDVDDCWAIASIWARRVSDPTIDLPTVPEFRAAANNPDRPGSTGGNIDDITLATDVLWPNSGRDRIQTTYWPPVMALLRAGWSLSLSVLSSRLPLNLRFGFYGTHQIGVVYRAGVLLVANPLAPQGSYPIPITESALRAAAYAVTPSGSWILAVAYPPPTGDDMLVLVTETPFPTPRTFTVPAGTVLSGYDPARPGAAVKTSTFDDSSSARASAMVYVTYPGDATPPVPKGGPFLRVVDGAFAGLLIVQALVKLAPATDTGYNAGLSAAAAAVAAVPRK